MLRTKLPIHSKSNPCGVAVRMVSISACMGVKMVWPEDNFRWGSLQWYGAPQSRNETFAGAPQYRGSIPTCFAHVYPTHREL